MPTLYYNKKYLWRWRKNGCNTYEILPRVSILLH
jgi:hypothetical protein